MKNTYKTRISQAVVGFLVGGSFLLVAAPLLNWSVAHADDSETTLFSDNFEQDGSSLGPNNWSTFSGASSPSRTTGAGASGKGLNLEGSNSSNPDDGAERVVTTKGYSSVRIEYSRKISGFGSGDQFVAQYAFDNDSFTTLETLTSDQSHSVTSFTVPNSDRHTRLTVRFFVNANNDGDTAGVDDVVVYGTGAPAFYDGFESNDFATGSWISEGSPLINTSDSNVWTDNNISSDSHAANLDAVNTGTDDAITKSFDATGYQNIKVRYARKVDNLSSGENLTVYYSTDNGSS
jgi:hypothetical protein